MWAPNLFMPEKRDKTKPVLKAYLDESGIHDNAKVCVVAGYFGGINAWNKFEREWKEVLAVAGIDEFHAQRFFTRDGNKRVRPYKDWDDKRADGFLQNLLRVISENKIHPFGASVVLSEWKTLSLDEKRWMTGGEYDEKSKRFKTTGAPSKCYFLPFQCDVVLTARYCHAGVQMDFVFDENKELKGYANNLYELLKRMPLAVQGKLGKISFESSRKLCNCKLRI
jgi:hypothetical protein